MKILLLYGAKANVPNNQGLTALHLILAARPPASIIEILIKEGQADVNAQDSKGDAALHKVAYSDRSLGNLFDVNIARILLMYGAKVDMSNLEGNTPLHIAIESRQDMKEALFFFCNEGHANVNAQNKAGDSPFTLTSKF